MQHRLKSLITSTHTDFFEVFNAVLLIAWGSWLLLPFDTFHNVGAFSFLAKIIPETIFALIPFVIGLYILYTLITFRERRRNKGLLISTTFWVFICVIIGAASATAPHFRAVRGLSEWLL